MNINVADFVDWTLAKVIPAYYTDHDDSDDIAFWEIEDAITESVALSGTDEEIAEWEKLQNERSNEWIAALETYAKEWEQRKFNEGMKMVSRAKYEWCKDGYEHLKPCHLH